MRYVIITLIAIVLLLVQSSLSKKRKMALIFILPVLSIAAGFAYQGLYLKAIQLSGLYPFLIAAGCLLLFGVIKRLDNRKKEMEHMKSQDL